MKGRIGVVIPVVNCACRQLNALIPQLGYREQLVIVRNGKATHRCTPRDSQVCQVEQIDAGRKPIGAAAARNLGVSRLNDCDIVAFVDSDDQVAPGWLDEIVKELVAGRADLVGGALSFRRHDGSASVVLPGRDYWHAQAVFGGSLAVSIRAWQVLEGFDETLRCCEDTDLAWRAHALGLKVLVEPGAIVEVEARGHLDEIRQRIRWGWWSGELLRRHQLCNGHLPARRELIGHKKALGFCASWRLSATAQWLGERLFSLNHAVVRTDKSGAGRKVCQCQAESCPRCKHQTLTGR